MDNRLPAPGRNDPLYYNPQPRCGVALPVAGCHTSTLGRNMKTNYRRPVLMLTALALALVATGYTLVTMPLKYHDEQGVRLAAHLRKRGMEAYYSEHPYLSITGWKKGTDVFVYGITSNAEFPEIIETIKGQKPETNIWITFYSGTHEQNQLLGRHKVRNEN